MGAIITQKRSANLYPLPRCTQTALSLAGTLVLWLCVATMCQPGPVVGWWRCGEWIAAWCVCFFVSCTTEDRLKALTIFSSASSIAALVAVPLALWFNDWSIGFGNPNYLITCTLPGICAGLFLIGSKDIARNRDQVALRIVCVLGLVALLYFSWLYGRRMPLVAISAGFLFVGIYALALRRLWAAWLVSLVVLALFISATMYLWDVQVRDVRFERLQFWKSAIDQIAERPLGWGAYGTLRVGEAAGEAARHLTAGGNIDRHAHMEILDLAVTGGIPALILVLAAAVGLIASVKRRPDESQLTAYALAAGLGTWLTCWSLDNAQSELPALMIGATWCGLILGGRDVLSQPLSAMSLLVTPVRYLGILMGLVLTLYLIPAATLPWDQPKAHLEWAFRQTRQADLELKFYDELVSQARSTGDLASVQKYTNLVVDRLGWVGNTKVHALTTATTASDPAPLLALALSVCHSHPFHSLGFAFAHHLARTNATQGAVIPERLAHRIAIWHGDLEVKPTSSIVDIEDAADAVACLNAALRLKREPPAHTSEILESLVNRYGDLSDIGLLILACRAEWGEQVAPWAVARAPELRWALTRQPGALLNTLTQVETQPQARAHLWPVLSAAFPRTALGFVQGTPARDPNVDDNLRLKLLKFYSMRERSK